MPDETLPGYILRLSHRLDLTPARVIEMTGLRPNGATMTAILGLPASTVATFAQVTRMSQIEASELLMVALADRYPPLDPFFLDRHGELRAIVAGEAWVLVSSTRYCSRCLAGDGSIIQNRHGGPWRRAWRLPITFSCLKHRTLLGHLCPQCGHPIHNRAHRLSAYGLVTHSFVDGLHPAQCRLPLSGPRSNTRRVLPACGMRLDRHHANPPVDEQTLAHLLKVQHHLTTTLEADSPTLVSCGIPTTAPNYFIDLRVMAEVISSSWPAARAFAPSAAIAELVDRTVELRKPNTSTLRNGRQRTHRADPHRRPPLAADECGALLATTTHVLATMKDPTSTSELLTELLEQDQTSATQPATRTGLIYRVLQRTHNHCSEGLRSAIDIARQPDWPAYIANGTKAW